MQDTSIYLKVHFDNYIMDWQRKELSKSQQKSGELQHIQCGPIDHAHRLLSIDNGNRNHRFK